MTEPVDRATLRDVFGAVNDLRDELVPKIDGLAALVNTVAVSHEHRLTVAEQQGGAHSEQLASLTVRVDGHGRDISTLQDKQREDEAASAALLNARRNWQDWRRWAVGMIVSVSGVVALFITVIH